MARPLTSKIKLGKKDFAYTKRHQVKVSLRLVCVSVAHLSPITTPTIFCYRHVWEISLSSMFFFLMSTKGYLFANYLLLLDDYDHK